MPDRPSLHPTALESIAATTAAEAAELVRSRLTTRDNLATTTTAATITTTTTKSSPTDIVTDTDVDSERLIHDRLAAITPRAGFVGEERGGSGPGLSLQWVVDPLDGTVNFWYGLPVFAVSIAAAVDGVVVAGAVVDVASGETFSAAKGCGSRLNGHRVGTSGCATLSQALVTTGFSYRSDLRAAQGAVVAQLLPRVRDIRCFGSAALQLCWVACGRSDGHFERDIKLWDYSAGALVAAEAGATIELPCPENDGLVIAAGPTIFEPLRRLLDPA